MPAERGGYCNNESGERQSRTVREHADPYEANGGYKVPKCGMVPALERAIRMPADQHHPNHSAYIGHGREQANRDVAVHAETLDDARNPESDRYRGAGCTEVDDGEEPYARVPHRLAESVRAGTGVDVIRIEISQDELLLTLRKPARLAWLVRHDGQRRQTHNDRRDAL